MTEIVAASIHSTHVHFISTFTFKRSPHPTHFFSFLSGDNSMTKMMKVGSPKRWRRKPDNPSRSCCLLWAISSTSNHLPESIRFIPAYRNSSRKCHWGGPRPLISFMSCLSPPLIIVLPSDHHPLVSALWFFARAVTACIWMAFHSCTFPSFSFQQFFASSLPVASLSSLSFSSAFWFVLFGWSESRAVTACIWHLISQREVVEGMASTARTRQTKRSPKTGSGMMMIMRRRRRIMMMMISL